MMNTVIEIWMVIIGCLMAISEIPQIIKLYRRKSSEDISLTMWYLIVFGIFNWLLYGIYKTSPSLIITNIICLTTGITIIILTHKYRRPNVV